MKTTVQEVVTFLGLDEPVRRDFPLVRAGPPTDVSDGTLTLVTRKVGVPTQISSRTQRRTF